MQRAHQGLAQHDRRPGAGGFAQVQHDGARGAAGQLEVDGVYGMAVFDTDPGLLPGCPATVTVTDFSSAPWVAK